MATKKSAATAAPNNQSTQGGAKSHAFFTQKVKLHSFHAQQVFDRGFEICSNAVFTLSVVLRMISTEDQAREVEGIVDERINKTFEDLRGEALRLEKLAESNGIEFVGVEYTNPKEFEAKITSPRIVRYVGLIREFDGLVAKIDTLWLSGVIPDSNYSRSIYEWKRRLLRLAGTIRSISTRAMIAARRKETQKESGKASNTNQADEVGDVGDTKNSGSDPGNGVENPSLAEPSLA
ncbi:AcaB family transcriptional regulator [Sulfuricystis multivorans]|uniref:AcaB family transcriptional regulator n=1 Tax=Sulfuricystis multivorans TaxID=2211108 RepID=UPI000F8280F7|nr:AcaB family transcriptional regulator [Sulfuricystis multivorans]